MRDAYCTLNELKVRLTLATTTSRWGSDINALLPCAARIVTSESPHRLRLRRLLLHLRRLLHLLLLLRRAATVAARPGLHLPTPALHAPCTAWST